MRVMRSNPLAGRVALGLLGLSVALGAVMAKTAAAATADPCLTSINGALCNDGNACTRNDVCLDGVCTGIIAPEGTDCTDGSLCTTMDRCAAGVCVGQVVPEGDACDDGDKCTTGERCSAGLCTPIGTLTCDDANVCTNDACLPTKGCVFTLVPNPIPMCVPPDAGAGGQSGSGGAAGQGGTGGRGAIGGTGGQGGGGSTGQGGASTPDAGAPDAAGDADVPDAQAQGGSGGEPGWDARGDGEGGVDSSSDPIAYEVEGGAILCSFRPHSQGAVGVLPWLGLLGLAFFGLRRARSARR